MKIHSCTLYFLLIKSIILFYFTELKIFQILECFTIFRSFIHMTSYNPIIIIYFLLCPYLTSSPPPPLETTSLFSISHIIFLYILKVYLYNIYTFYIFLYVFIGPCLQHFVFFWWFFFCICFGGDWWGAFPLPVEVFISYFYESSLSLYCLFMCQPSSLYYGTQQLPVCR